MTTFCLMRAIKVITQWFILIVGFTMFSASVLLTTAPSTSNGTVRAVDLASDRAMFNPAATLDTSQVSDTRGAEPITPLASDLNYSAETVIVPEGQSPDTTPVVRVADPNGATIWIPEEDPNGGHPTQARAWLDNSPLYSGGWLLQINDVAGTVQWLDVQERLTLDDDESTDQGTDQYGAGAGAVCGTDAQCAAWSEAHGEVPSGYAADKGHGVQTVAYTTTSKRHGKNWAIAEDGSLVPPSYYSHVTKAGATQARCDYLGKRRVADQVYGHRCV